MAKVQIEVEEGSRAWAIAVVAAGCDGVVHPELKGKYRTFTPWEYTALCFADGWRLYVEPPQPITVQPGTMEWALVQWARGKIIRSPSTSPSAERDFPRMDGPESYFSPEERAATDWEAFDRMPF